MPKKRNNLKQFQGSSSASGKQSAADNGGTSPSVNERLSELRKLEGKDAERKKAELAESSTSKSVPPSLRSILGIPDSAPPQPKRGVRLRLVERTRTPGPAPPASWTKVPGWTPLVALRIGRRRFKSLKAADNDRNRPGPLLRFAQMTSGHDEEPERTPSSLLHMSLKTAAEQWTLFDEEDYPALAELPLRLRVRLISYIGFYGPTLDIHEIDALIQGNEALTQLDLAGLIGFGNLSISRITKLAKQQPQKLASSDETVLDSWDQDTSFEVALTPPVTRFEQLTHLSLSHPGPGVSWRDLLSLSKHLPCVTHLSLAYWPRPTLTPNLATATVSSQYSPDVAAGGSHFYSVLDQDLSEPAAIVRQLSAHLLRLVWLDLEGCTEWVSALSAHDDTSSAPHMRPRDGQDEWLNTTSATNVFLRNWTKLAYINCSQGWLPEPIMLDYIAWKVNNTQRSIIDKVVNSVNRLDGFRPMSTEAMPELNPVNQRNALMWLELQERALTTERKINALRRNSHIAQVHFDHGWNDRV